MPFGRRKPGRYGWRGEGFKTEGDLTYDEVQMLGTYNSERARGLMHTPEWQQRMAELQHRFDNEEDT